MYRGRLPAQTFDREAIGVAADLEQQQDTKVQDVPIPFEPRYLYSNRSYWYPQSIVTDYATAKLRITVPAEYDVVASGRSRRAARSASGRAGRNGRARCSCSTRRSRRAIWPA